MNDENMTIDQMIAHLQGARDLIGGDKIVHIAHEDEDGDECERPVTNLLIRILPVQDDAVSRVVIGN